MMGYNTVAVILNDALSGIADDPEFGKRLRSAVLQRGMGRRDDSRSGIVPAHGAGIRFCNAAEIISCDHADGHQVVVVHGNTGWSLDDLPDNILDETIQRLKWRGWRLSKIKQRAPRSAKQIEPA